MSGKSLENFTLNLVSPEKLLFSKEVFMVVIPGEQGDFGVKVHHVPMVSSLRPGLMTIYETSGNKEYIFISGGFANVHHGGCDILAEHCEFIKDIEKESLDEYLKNLEDEISIVRTEEERRSLLNDQKLAHLKREIMDRLSYSKNL
jgi:F-type H+-transporting ATPase subunit epsilon